MPAIMPQIKHVIVVMMENRSFDNMLGWLYPDGAKPARFLPPSNTAPFDGLDTSIWNPSNADYFDGKPEIPIRAGVAQAFNVPQVDPQETFDNISEQLFGPPNATRKTSNRGFLINYQKTKAANPGQIMQGYSCEQVPVLAGLARNYAVCDAWFASVPTQTLPNRAFVHAGTSNGHVDNGRPWNPLVWHVPTIFNVLSDIDASWRVYSHAGALLSLTRTMMPCLWPLRFEENFHGFQRFLDDCSANTLPQYTFIEPSIFGRANDQHPPRDVRPGEAFLHDIYSAVRASPAWQQTLLIITYDEHGGCFDHVPPPGGAFPPDAQSQGGDEGFRFDRFGVRVPTVVVSAYVEPGTVFRSDSDVPYDHTSILATLRDWLQIRPDAMLSSQRIAHAPTLAQILTLTEPRQDHPELPSPTLDATVDESTAPLNEFQKIVVSAAAHRFASTTTTMSQQNAVDFMGTLSENTP